MKKIIAIGEALIDMISSSTNTDLKNSVGFIPCVGGAPLNVLGAVAKLGGKASLISMLGNDAFGDKIISFANKCGIDTSYVLRTDIASTALAFVSLKDDGNRDFSFYRKPSADMLLQDSQIDKEWFSHCYALHFCSVDLVESPMKYAHIRAIEYAKEKGAYVSFDPNLRFSLWDNTNALKVTVNDFIHFADILKISDEELEFITGETDIFKALPKLFVGDVKLIVYTCGSKGAYAITKTNTAFSKSYKVVAVDTTGAGDGFIGSFLYQLAQNNSKIEHLSETELEEMLNLSSKFCAKSVEKRGAIDSYPTMAEMKGGL